MPQFVGIIMGVEQGIQEYSSERTEEKKAGLNVLKQKFGRLGATLRVSAALSLGIGLPAAVIVAEIFSSHMPDTWALPLETNPDCLHSVLIQNTTQRQLTTVLFNGISREELVAGIVGPNQELLLRKNSSSNFTFEGKRGFKDSIGVKENTSILGSASAPCGDTRIFRIREREESRLFTPVPFSPGPGENFFVEPGEALSEAELREIIRSALRTVLAENPTPTLIPTSTPLPTATLPPTPTEKPTFTATPEGINIGGIRIETEGNRDWLWCLVPLLVAGFGVGAVALSISALNRRRTVTKEEVKETHEVITKEPPPPAAAVVTEGPPKNIVPPPGPEPKKPAETTGGNITTTPIKGETEKDQRLIDEAEQKRLADERELMARGIEVENLTKQKEAQVGTIAKLQTEIADMKAGAGQGVITPAAEIVEHVPPTAPAAGKKKAQTSDGKGTRDQKPVEARVRPEPKSKVKGKSSGIVNEATQAQREVDFMSKTLLELAVKAGVAERDLEDLRKTAVRLETTLKDEVKTAEEGVKQKIVSKKPADLSERDKKKQIMIETFIDLRNDLDKMEKSSGIEPEDEKKAKEKQETYKEKLTILGHQIYEWLKNN